MKENVQSKLVAKRLSSIVKVKNETTIKLLWYIRVALDKATVSLSLYLFIGLTLGLLLLITKDIID